MKSSPLRYGRAWLPYALASGFLVFIGLLLLAMRYGVFPRVQLPVGGFGTFMIWLSVFALLAIAMWLLFFARDVYLRQRRLARRRASQRARAKSASDSGLYITAIGGGTGLSITPVAFLTVGKDADVSLIHVNDLPTDVDRITGLIERAPEIIERIKNALS